MRLADLTYTEEDLAQDAIHYFETAVYEPSYAENMKKFIADDLEDFTDYYNDSEYAFCNIYADEFQKGYVDDGETVSPRADFKRLTALMNKIFAPFAVDEDEIERYIFALDAEFRKNAYCSHMEPYFVGTDAVISTVVTGYARNPLFSIYSMVREWCMALHFKYMHPELMRKFGYRYQLIRSKYTGEERLKRLVGYRERYKLTMQNVGTLRAVHSSVFAYVYLYLKAVTTNETLLAERFILDSSTSQIFLLLQGEAIQNIDYPVVKYALERLKEGDYKKLMNEMTGAIYWDNLYVFVMDAIKNVGNIENLRNFSFDSIDAKSIQSFWNKSANMQSMLKILRRLAMDNRDPIINRLIEMCEYRLGRPDKTKEKMERFIEETRRILAARAYELTKPRTMDQTLIAAFPSVFLVYFQWHHNFRTIYPKVPKKQVENDLNKMRQQAESTLKNRIYADDTQKVKFREVAREQVQKTGKETERMQLRREDDINRMRRDDERLRLSLQDREQRQIEVKEKQRQEDDKSRQAAAMLERNQRQNSL